MKTKLLLGDYVSQRVRISPFLHDDVLKVVGIVARRGESNRIQVVRLSDKQLGWVDEDNLIRNEVYL